MFFRIQKKSPHNELSPESWTVKKVPKIAISIFGIIFYTHYIEECEEFKSRVVREHDKEGKSAKQIFAEAGIPDWLNSGDYAKDNMKRWRRISKRKDTLKRGRPTANMNKPISEMSLEELRRRVAYLELENEFLKKLEPLEQYKNKN